MTLIDDDAVESALNYLATTDESCAVAKALMKRLDHERNTARSLAMLDVDEDIGRYGKKMTVAAKESLAYTSERYQEWLEDYGNAVAEYEIVNNKRATEIARIEVWRSEQANRRRGNT